MIRFLPKLLFSYSKIVAPKFYKNPLLHSGQFLRWETYTSPKPTKLQIGINSQLMQAKDEQQLMKIYTTSKTSMNLVNLSVLLKQLSRYSKDKKGLLNLDEAYKDILDTTASKIAKDSLDDPRLVANLYFDINSLRFKSPLILGCNSKLEEKGMLLHKSMNYQEISNFVYVLSQNNKKTEIAKIIPFVSANIEKYNMRALTTILRAISVLNIVDSSLASRVQQHFINYKEALRPNARDFSLLFYYCGKNAKYINKPKFFSKLEEMATYQVNYSNNVEIATIFHSLTFHEKPMMSLKFYQLFETPILNSLASLKNRSLSMILRGYSKFGFGSDNFFAKMSDEISKRIDTFDAEDFSTILYHLANRKNVSTEMMDSFSKSLITTNLKNFTTKQFQHILYSLSFLARENLYKPSDELIKVIVNYILENIDNFSIKEFANIATQIFITEPRSQKQISQKMKERIKNKGFADQDFKDLRALSEIAFFTLKEFPEGEFIQYPAIFISIVHSTIKDIGSLKENTKPSELKFYGKLLVALTEQNNLDQTSSGQRDDIIQIFESWLIDVCKIESDIPHDFCLRRTLMNFIIPFYTRLENPTDNTKQIFKKALKLHDPKEFKPEHIDFLKNSTDLWS